MLKSLFLGGFQSPEYNPNCEETKLEIPNVGGCVLPEVPGRTGVAAVHESFHGGAKLRVVRTSAENGCGAPPWQGVQCQPWMRPLGCKKWGS